MSYSDYLGIILNEDLLQSSHIPARLPGREEQLETLKDCLRPAASGGKPHSAWVYGFPGSGKTSSAKFVLGRLSEEVGVRWAYVDCSLHSTFHAVLHSILVANQWVNTENNSAAKFATLKRFLGNKPFVVVLDEVQRMPAPQLERALEKLVEIENLGLVCVSYSRERFMFMPERVRDKFNPKLVSYHRYSVADISHILEERAKAALLKESWSQLILENIAELAKGNARLAIQTLRAAAHHAESDFSSSIEQKHIDRAFKNTLHELRTEAAQKLDEHQLILYQAIMVAGSMQSKPLREIYLKCCESQGKTPLGERALDGCLRELRYMKLIARRRVAVKGKVFTYSLE